MGAREILQEYEKGTRDFQRVSLRGLSFKGKDLSGANFSGADIRGTNFRGANLTGADFSGADIRGTNFHGVNLTGANFRGAKAGLEKLWVVFLLYSVFFLVGISVYLNLLISNLTLQILGH